MNPMQQQRPPNPMVQFRQHKINIPNLPGVFLAPQKAAEILAKGLQIAAQSHFEWTIIDKPIDGAMLLFQTPPGQGEIPEDGYGWMDDESYQKITLENGMELEIFTRSQGFGLGEATCAVYVFGVVLCLSKRKRFRLARQPDYQLMHYIRLPGDASTVQIQMNLVKVRPRPPNALPQHPMMLGGMQRQGLAQSMPQRMPQAFPNKQQIRNTPQVVIRDEEKDLPGDPLDESNGRSLAFERYRRNVNLIETIFSPRNISNLSRPTLFADPSKERLDIIKQHLVGCGRLTAQKEVEGEIAALEDKNQMAVQDFRTKAVQEWKLIHELKAQSLMNDLENSLSMAASASVGEDITSSDDELELPSSANEFIPEPPNVLCTAFSTAEEVRGPAGQVCQSKMVLDTILTKYSHITSNTFKGGATGKIKAEYMICECRYNHREHCRRNAVVTDEPWMACGIDSGCINRELSIECPEDGCPCGPFCQNRKYGFSLRHYAPIQVFDTHSKGFGLRTKMALKRGSFVIEYCGEVITTNILKKRIVEHAKTGAKHFYFMALKSNEVCLPISRQYIDASRKGNISRFMNHSCNPNCALQKWVVGSHMRIGIFAIKDIPEGTELTFDYQFENYGAEPQPCYCGEAVCTGFIGKEPQSDDSGLAAESEEELSEEEPDDDESPDRLRTQAQGKALQSFDQVKDIVKYLMMHSGNPSKVLRAINKLLKTETQVLLRKFIHFRGLYLLERCLSQHISTKSIVKHNILLVLQMLPISTKNAIVKLETMVQQMTNPESFGYATAELAKKVLESWIDLEMVYKIPKRTKSEIDSDDHSDPASKKHKPATIDSDFHRQQVNSPEQFRAAALDASRQEPLPQRDPRDFMAYKAFTSVVLKEVEVSRPEFAWNQIIAPLKPADSLSETNRSNEVTTPVSEMSIEQMVEAAQEATRLRQEAIKKKLQMELEEQKKAAHSKKKKIAERKEKQRELSQALGKRLVEKAKAETKKAAADPLPGKERQLTEEEKSLMKKNLSAAIIKIMSRYKDQMTGDSFKERAKIITKGLLEKEVRKYSESKKPVPNELSEGSQKAVKNYVKEYLGRHNINVD
ncbi:histone methyltransferase set2 [Kappamyces sp. JEL0680]|nr:histone methyltransferase set2 [Kappamyces sp. JEL0680]